MPSSNTAKESKLLKEYLEFLRNHQCSAEATIVIRKMFIQPFLMSIGRIGRPSTLHLLTAKTIHEYIIDTSEPLNRASKKHLSSTLRSFLKFAFIKSYLKTDMTEAVPVITTRKLDRLPEIIPWKSVMKLLSMPDRGTSSGRRDYAVMLLCIHYGLRIGQVLALKLDDIHWEDEFIHFPACKQSNALRLPLNAEVVDALLDYIKSDRLVSNFQEVFLTLKSNQRPLSKHNHYYGNIQKYYVKAGIATKSQGTRNLRHAFASHMLSHKVPIKTIADLLGHRYIQTTFNYTKVDYDQLRTLARQWPEVQQ